MYYCWTCSNRPKSHLLRPSFEAVDGIPLRPWTGVRLGRKPVSCFFAETVVDSEQIDGEHRGAGSFTGPSASKRQLRATRNSGCCAANHGARALAIIATRHELYSIVRGARLRSRLVLRCSHPGCVRGVSECISGSRQCCLFPGNCKQTAAQLTLRVNQDGTDLNKYNLLSAHWPTRRMTSPPTPVPRLWTPLLRTLYTLVFDSFISKALALAACCDSVTK